MNGFRSPSRTALQIGLTLLALAIAGGGPIKAETPVKAPAELENAVAKAPNDIDAVRARGDYFYSKSAWQQALTDYDKLTELAPNAASGHERQGMARMKLGRFDDAIASYTTALEKDPKRVSVLNNLGLVYIATRSYDLALDRFAQAIALDPKLATAYTNRGRLYNEKGKWQSAIAEFDKSIEIDPASPLPWFYRSISKVNSDGAVSHVYADLTKRNSIIADVVRAIQLDPGTFKEYVKISKGYFAKGSFKRQQAMALLSGLIAAAPKDADVLVLFGDAQVAAFQSDDAILSYTKALALNPKLASALLGRATARHNSAIPYKDPKFALAIEDFKAYLALNPKDSAALTQLGICQYNDGETNAGIETFRNLLKADDTDTYGHLGLGLGLAIAGDKEGATKEIEPALKKATPAQIEQARSDFGNASGHYPNSEAVKSIVALLPAPPADTSGLEFLFL